MTTFFTELYGRFHQLHADLEQALELLPAEALDWQPGKDMNSASVLVVHLTGAERFLIGDVVMGEPSNRNRDDEFRATGLDKAFLLERIHQTDQYTAAALDKLELSDLETTRLHPRDGKQVSVAWALLHALEHVSQHLGHLQLTAQLWQQKH